MRQRLFLKQLKKSLLLLLIPMLLLAVFSNIYIGSSIRAQIDANNQQAIAQAGSVCNLLFQTIDSVAVFSSSNYRMVSMLKSYADGSSISMNDVQNLTFLHKSMLSLIAACPYLYSIDLYLNGESKFYSSDTKITSVDGTAEGRWLRSLEPIHMPSLYVRSLVSPFAADPGHEVISFAKPAFSGLLSVNGFAVINIDIQQLKDYLNTLSLGDGQLLYLLDGTQHVCINADAPLEMAIVSAMLHEGQHVAEAEWHHVPSRVTISTIPRYEWYFIAVTPMRQLYAVQEKLMLIFGVVSMLCTVGTVLSAWHIASREQRRALDIVKAVEAVMNGVEPEPSPFDDLHTSIIQGIRELGVQTKLIKMQMNEKRYQMQLLEDRMLQYQINPHFQINTLRTIYWKIVKHEGIQSDSAQMVENMLDFMGYVLSDPHQTVTLREEVQHTRSFTEILETRHQDDVSFSWDISDDCLDAACCRLMLEPYLENAFYHGLRGWTGDTNVHTTARKEGDLVIIEISDHGRGIPPEKLSQIQQALRSREAVEGSIGIFNPHRRIVLRFGEIYGVNIVSQIHKGTTVCICIPYQPFRG